MLIAKKYSYDKKERNKATAPKLFVMSSCKSTAPKIDKNSSKIALEAEFKDGSC